MTALFVAVAILAVCAVLIPALTITAIWLLAHEEHDWEDDEC